MSSPSYIPHQSSFAVYLRRPLFLHPQGCDDGVIRQYNINHKNPLQGEIHLKPPTNSYSTKPYITSIVINDDATFAMAADSSYRLSVIYLATGTVVSSTDTPFLPQALVFSNGSFYCGGSDRQNFKYSSVPHSLLCLDLQCHQKAITPVSASAVYAMASSATGMIAAGGYSPYTDNQHSAQCIDVYSIPPLRSFSIPI